MALQTPNHTKLSNEFIDEYMNEISGSGAKVFIAISRKTAGWQKISDYISISQIIKLTGLSNRVVIKAIKELEELDLIEVKRKNKSASMFTIKYMSSDEKSFNSDEKSQDGAKSSDEKSYTKEIFKETKQKKEKSKLEQDKKETLDIWNSYKDQYPDVIIYHTTNKLKKEHIEALKHYTKEQYMNAIWKYCEVHVNDKYWPTIKYKYKSINKFIDNIDNWVQTPIKDYIYVDPKEARKPEIKTNFLNDPEPDVGARHEDRDS